MFRASILFCINKYFINVISEYCLIQIILIGTRRFIIWMSWTCEPNHFSIWTGIIAPLNYSDLGTRLVQLPLQEVSLLKKGQREPQHHFQAPEAQSSLPALQHRAKAENRERKVIRNNRDGNSDQGDVFLKHCIFISSHQIFTQSRFLFLRQAKFWIHQSSFTRTNICCQDSYIGG